MMKKIFLFVIILLSCPDIHSQDIEYQIHEESHGWSQWVKSSSWVGSKDKRIEGIRIRLTGFPSSARILYRAHVQSQGWQPWAENGQMAGTEGKKLRMEAIEIKLKNAPTGYSICYNLKVGQRDNGSGFMDFGGPSANCDGGMAGTVGRRRPVEQLSIDLMYNGKRVNKSKNTRVRNNIISTQVFHSKTCNYDIYYSKDSGQCDQMIFAGTIGKNKGDISLEIKGKEEIWIRIYESGENKCQGDGRVLIRHSYIHPNATRSSYLREEVRKNSCDISPD